MSGEHPNAVAGPSVVRQPGATPHQPLPAPAGQDPTASSPSSATTSYTVPTLFLAPPGTPPPKQHLHSTQDLVQRFQLLSAYQKYVTSAGANSGAADGDIANANTSADGQTSGGASGGLDKGKGKEVPLNGRDVEMADANDFDDDDGAGGKDKKKKNSYKHLIKGIPGKHSLKKDDYLEKMMLVPPKQRIKIHRFDERTQEDAFAVSLEGLKQWSINALVLESAQAREDRKKRKELKRAAKLGIPLPPSTAPTISNSSIPGIVQPQPVQAAVRRAPGSGTPKPGVGTPRAASNASSTPMPVAASNGGGGAVPPRPPPTVPRPGSAVPRPGATVQKPGTQAQQGQLRPPQVSQAVSMQPPIARTGTPMDVDQQRGKKREREDGAAPVNGIHNGGAVPHANGNTANGQQKPALGMNAKAGTGNIRPRPIKKQRMDMQGQAREVAAPVQQPTPQGV